MSDPDKKDKVIADLNSKGEQGQIDPATDEETTGHFRQDQMQKILMKNRKVN